ncbi:hypothetical protein B0H10DRAFT_1914386 [Mycena sp. CBHHK59/15]|nr:hypothetical protein B0H10DRAFT_1914386 [Mycena sp. CBHHK59/15]
MQPELRENSYPSLPALPHHLLTSNDALSDDEIAEICETVAAGHARVADLDVTLAALEGRVKVLRQKRNDVLEHVHRGTMLLSVLRRLPADILGEVFAWAVLFSYRDARGSTWKWMERNPWALSHVCSRWRAIAISLPLLWSHIESGVPPRMLAALIARSVPCSMTIELRSSDVEALQVLVQHSHRWGALILHITAQMLPVLMRVRGLLPVLRQLKCWNFYHTDTDICDAFETAPMLTDITLTASKLQVLPWNQLTRLRLFTRNSDGLYPLGSTQNLVKLSLLNPSESFIWALASVAIELPRLRALLVIDGRILDYMVLPALEDIWVVRYCLRTIPLVARSACRLRTFGNRRNFNPADILAILDGVPTLVEVVGCLGDASLLARLTIPSHPVPDFQPVAPELRALSLQVTLTREVCSELIKVVRSRHRSTMCPDLSLSLINVATDDGNVPPHAVQDMLSTLQQEGLHLEWLTTQATERYLNELEGGYP